ncbi:SH3 domain-containing protein [Bradyrhizobium canariense]|uniref:Uncharacterized conserved protein YraI n=1 Tax=Bradyrhizobium canariense TaxID=255045 RepID=A0A1H1ZA51_9BRAD|nr:SH3 domain-containing protein [Bradyrhizobium canariense]SDT30533.1 Uncharacterized conserved protein YraI [Bradyrhizobium canariense]
MSFVRVAASAVIFTLMSAVCATAKPIVIGKDTNLRKSPGTTSEVVTLLTTGTMVEIGKCSNGWCEASFDGKDGYVIAQNVGMAPVRRPPPRGSEMVEEVDDYAPPPGYVVGPPVYYGYGPYYGYGYGYGWGYRGGWGWGRRW